MQLQILDLPECDSQLFVCRTEDLKKRHTEVVRWATLAEPISAREEMSPAWTFKAQADYVGIPICDYAVVDAGSPTELTKFGLQFGPLIVRLVREAFGERALLLKLFIQVLPSRNGNFVRMSILVGLSS